MAAGSPGAITAGVKAGAYAGAPTWQHGLGGQQHPPRVSEIAAAKKVVLADIGRSRVKTTRKATRYRLHRLAG